MRQFPIVSFYHINMRIAIAGAPKTGKTTEGERLHRELGCPLRHTDSLIGVLDWSAASQEVSRWFEYGGSWIIEGVAVPRALRKWFRRRSDAPADRIIWLGTPHVPVNDKQIAMGKACRTVLDEVMPALVRSGVTILEQ